MLTYCLSLIHISGSLVTRLTNDVQQVQQVMMMGLRLALRAPGMLVGALIMAFLMNPRLALIILVVIPLLAAAIAAIMTTAYPRFGIMQTKLDLSLIHILVFREKTAGM